MDFRGLVVGAGNVAQGYRSAETALRAAEQERLNLQRLRMEQAERERVDAERRAILVKPPELPEPAVPLRGVPEQPIGGLRLPARADLPVRDVRPPAAPPEVWAERGPGEGDTPYRVASPEMYVGSVPAPVTPLAPEGTPVDPERLARAQGVYRLAAMNLRDAEIGLEALRARGASAEEIAQWQRLVDRRRTDLQAADQGIRRIVPTAVTTPVGRPAAPTTPAGPGTVPATMPPNALGESPTRVLPETQAQFDAQAAGIKAAELGTVARADEELSAIDRELRKRNLPVEMRATLRRERGFVAAAREQLAQQEAVAPAAAAEPTAVAPAEPTPGPVANVFQPTAGVTTPEEDVPVSQIYAVNPAQITFDQQFLVQTYESQRQITTDAAVSTLTNLDTAYNAERATLVAQYNAQMAAGRGNTAMATRNQIIALDAKYREGRTLAETGARSELLEQDRKYELGRFALAGLAAAAQLEYQNNPAGAAQILSYAFGQPMQFQLRSDGNFDMLLQVAGGQFAPRGTYSSRQLVDMLRGASDEAYRSARATAQQEQALKVSEEQARMIREVAVARVQAQGRQAEIVLQGQQYDMRPTGDGSGTVLLFRKDGTQAGIIDANVGKEIPGPEGQPMPAPPTVRWLPLTR